MFLDAVPKASEMSASWLSSADSESRPKLHRAFFFQLVRLVVVDLKLLRGTLVAFAVLRWPGSVP
jgi:hypothetical protein